MGNEFQTAETKQRKERSAKSVLVNGSNSVGVVDDQRSQAGALNLQVQKMMDQMNE